MPINGQTDEILQVVKSKSGTPSLIQFNTKVKKLHSSEGKMVLKQYLKLNDLNDFKSLKKSTDRFGYSHERFQQYYNGIKVEFSEYIVHSDKSNLITVINGTAKSIKDLNTRPQMSEKSALESALRSINASKYMWEDENFESEIKKELNNKDATYFPEGELVIWSDWASEKVSLAYKFIINTLVPFSEKKIYIDAQNGNVLNLQDSNPDATAHARYIGTVDIATSFGTSDYILNDSERNIRTYNLEKGVNFGSADDFHDANNVWSYTEFHNVDMDDAAINAHWSAAKTYDFFNQPKFENRDGWDGNGSVLKLYSHYSLNYGNAFSNVDKIVMGDGNTGHMASRPWTDVDVVAHEYGHAIFYDEVGAPNYTGEPGAIAEGLSDIWGASVEDYCNLTGHNKWLMFDNVFYDSEHTRNLTNPPLSHVHLNPYQTTEETPYPDVYGGDLWYTGSGDNYGVHINSTVLTHWFYLLCEGGSGANSEGDPYFIEPVGFNDVQELVFHIEKNWLTPNSNYDQFVFWSYFDALLVLGWDAIETVQLLNAWYAVGLGSPVAYNIDGPESVCESTNATYSIAAPSYCSISWNPGPNIQWISGTNPATFHMSGSGYSYINATIDYGCGPIEITKNITINSPHDVEIWAEGGNGNNAFYFYATPYNPGDNIVWAVYPSGTIINAYDAYAYIGFDYPGYYYIMAHVENACGSGDIAYIDFQVYENYYLSPNPATTEIKITVNEIENNEKAVNVLSTYDVSILDLYGNLVYRKEHSGKSFTIPVYNLKNGNYFVKIMNGGKEVTKKIVIRK